MMRSLRALFAVAAALLLGGQTIADKACPTTPGDALARYWKGKAIDSSLASRLVLCEQPLAREAAYAVLGDSEATPATLALIAEGLTDPVETVRRQALIAVIRNADAIRPLLAERARNDTRFWRKYTDFPDKYDAPRSYPAAAALAVIGAGSEDMRALAPKLRSYVAEVPQTRPAGRDLSNPQMLSGMVDVTSRQGRENHAAELCQAELADLPLMPDRKICPAATAAEQRLIAALAADAGYSPQVLVFESILADLTLVYDKAGSGRSRPIATRGFMLAQPPARSRVGAVRGSAAATVPASLPRFPWPAPQPVRQQVIPLSQLGGSKATLGQVADALRIKIQASDTNYETGLFSGPPDGFVLMTRIERIQDDGSPFPAPNRFTTKGNPRAGFWDSVRGLMGERPGYFRVIAFVVTANVKIDPRQPVSSIPIQRIGDVQQLPSALANQPIGNRRVIAFVYAFERKAGQAQRPWTDGAPSALKHLQRSGIGRRLGL